MAYSYRLTERALRLLPKHYIDRCTEFNNRPAPILNFIPDQRTHKRDEWGVIKPVENIPPPITFPLEVNDGLWGGEGYVHGFIPFKHKRIIRMPKRWMTDIVFAGRPKLWLPPLSNQVLYSEILDRHLLITITERVHNIIDDMYGIDAYILKTHERDLNSRLGMNLKRDMMVTLAKKSMYPDDPKKREAIYEKYKEFVIPLEEAEWVGLTVDDALEKHAEIEKMNNPIRPEKLQLAEQFLTKLTEPKDGEYQQGKVISLLSKLTPFKKTESSPTKDPS